MATPSPHGTDPVPPTVKLVVQPLLSSQSSQSTPGGAQQKSILLESFLTVKDLILSDELRLKATGHS